MAATYIKIAIDSELHSALTLGLGAASIAHAGVLLPVIAETTGMPSLAGVVKRIAPAGSTSKAGAVSPRSPT
jgi:hypothetical protein